VFAVSKRILPAVCLGLISSTASAAIPDANGVVHGCYNVLTGSARIVDGNSCNLLEKSVTWQQKGPQGPQGAQGSQGPQGAQGPAGSSSVATGSTPAVLGLSSGEEVVTIAPRWRYIATNVGLCTLTVTASIITNSNPAHVTVAPVFRVSGAGIQGSFVYNGIEAVLSEAPFFSPRYSHAPGDLFTTVQQGSSSVSYLFLPGRCGPKRSRRPC
jgi:hypothetical protein